MSWACNEGARGGVGAAGSEGGSWQPAEAATDQVSTHPEFVEAEDIENKNAIKHAWVSRAGSELPARSSRLFRSCRSCRRLCKLRHEMVMWQKGGIQSRFDKSLLSSRGVVTSEAPLSAVSKSARMLTPTRLL